MAHPFTGPRAHLGPIPWAARAMAGAGLVAVVLAVGPADMVQYLLRALPLGSVFTLMAVGLVLVYRASGVLHLAFAAQAFLSAAVFYDLRARHHWPGALALMVAVLIVAPGTGVVLEWALFRPLRTAPPTAKLVTSLALLVAIPEMTVIWFGRGSSFDPPSAFPDPGRVHRWGDYALDNHQIGTIVVTVLVVGGLTLALRTTSLGVQWRAVVESPRLAELAGVSADRVSRGAWVLSSLLAGVAGVLVAPLFAQVSAPFFLALLVSALAAAVLGGLSSIPSTALGAMVLASAMGLLGGELPQGSMVTQNLRPALPFVVLIVALAARAGQAGRNAPTDPLAGIDPPPPPDRPARHPPARVRVPILVAGATLAGGAVLGTGVLDGYWVNRLLVAVALSVCFLSITVVSGLAGTISLCPTAFAAVGAFTTAQVVEVWGIDVLSAMLVGALTAAATGAVVATLGIGLRGIHLSLLTLAVAVAFETAVVPLGWVSGGGRSLRVPRPTVGPVDFADDRAFLVLCTGFLVLAALAVRALARGTTGWFLDALRTSEAAAASIGIDPRRLLLVAFAVSAGIAGIGGALLATQAGIVGSRAHQAMFSSTAGLVWVTLVVTLGARSVPAALLAGFAFVFVPEAMSSAGLDPAWATVLFGLGALVYAHHPGGVVPAWTGRGTRVPRSTGVGVA